MGAPQGGVSQGCRPKLRGRGTRAPGGGLRQPEVGGSGTRLPLCRSLLLQDAPGLPTALLVEVAAARGTSCLPSHVEPEASVVI